MPGAPLRVRLGAWLLLGAWSAGLAEVLSGASPFLFVSAWGLLVTLPLYLLHAVVLVTLVHRATGRLSSGSLYLAGTLFGLYEAYVTKVLWTPTWDPIPVRLGGLHPFETVLLVLFWHPLVAFVVPVLVVETLATRSRLALDGLPPRVRWALVRSPGRLLVVLLATATVQGALSTPSGATLGGNLVAGAVLLGGTLAWRRRVGADRYALGDLLPEGRSLAVVVGLLAALYVVLGVLLRPEFLPALPAQATVWLLYAVLGGLLVLRLRVDRDGDAAASSPPRTAVTVSDRRLVAAVAGYVVLSAPATVLADPVAPTVYVALYATAGLVGALALGGVARTLVAARDPDVAIRS